MAESLLDNFRLQAEKRQLPRVRGDDLLVVPNTLVENFRARALARKAYPLDHVKAAAGATVADMEEDAMFVQATADEGDVARAALKFCNDLLHMAFDPKLDIRDLHNVEKGVPNAPDRIFIEEDMQKESLAFRVMQGDLEKLPFNAARIRLSNIKNAVFSDWEDALDTGFFEKQFHSKEELHNVERLLRDMFDVYDLSKRYDHSRIYADEKNKVLFVDKYLLQELRRNEHAYAESQSRYQE